VIDIARAFGVPPHMIGETTKSTSWGTGIEQQSIGFVKYTLGPHLKRFENEINRKLFRTSRYFMEHNADSLMAGDSKAQADYFAKAIGGPGAQGWMAVDEVRRKKNMKPMGGEFATVIKAGEAVAPKKEERTEDEDLEAAAARA
jgi:HK97 family phage portal protein